MLHATVLCSVVAVALPGTVNGVSHELVREQQDGLKLTFEDNFDDAELDGTQMGRVGSSVPLLPTRVGAVRKRSRQRA